MGKEGETISHLGEAHGGGLCSLRVPIMKVKSISGNFSPSVRSFSTRVKRGGSRGGGKLLKYDEIVDMVVVLEDGCGSFVLVDFRGF